MIDSPRIEKTNEQQTAVIRLTVPRADMGKVFGPAVQELMGVLAAQKIAPAGPLFAHHLQLDPATFDFELGVPVAQPVEASGRVKPGTLPAATVARAVHKGAYEGLPHAWGAFDAWVAGQGHTPAPSLWETYAVGPETSSDPADWRTELTRPLAG